MEEKVSCWELIQQKRFEEACKMADYNFLQSKSYSQLRNKIIALLNLKRYNEALDISLEIIKATNGRSDSDYIDSGISYWLLDRYEDAVSILKQGLNTPYTDAAGGVEVPSLLYFAAVYLKDDSLEKEIVSLLREKVKSKNSINYPGSIAAYIVGKINEEELLNAYNTFPELKYRVLCKSYFYIAVNYLKRGNKQAFYLNLENCTRNETYLENEYFFAVRELEKRA